MTLMRSLKDSNGTKLTTLTVLPLLFGRLSQLAQNVERTSIDLTLIQCLDVDSTLNRPCFNVVCLLGYLFQLIELHQFSELSVLHDRVVEKGPQNTSTSQWLSLWKQVIDITIMIGRT